MLTPTIDQGESTQNKADERGKQRAENDESSHSELLTLMREMKNKMKERDEQLREELRWRDTLMEE